MYSTKGSTAALCTLCASISARGPNSPSCSDHLYRWITPRPLHAWKATPAKLWPQSMTTNFRDPKVDNGQVTHSENTTCKPQFTRVLDGWQQVAVLHAQLVQTTC
jgi:hypothetical protein